MKRQLKSDIRLWTPLVFKRTCPDANITFAKSREIIEEIHLEMIEQLFFHRRPIELKKSMGYLEIKKCVIRGKTFISSYIMARRNETKFHKIINYLTGGKTYAIRFQFSRYGNYRLYKFKALKKHRDRLRELIINKNVPEF